LLKRHPQIPRIETTEHMHLFHSRTSPSPSRRPRRSMIAVALAAGAVLLGGASAHAGLVTASGDTSTDKATSSGTDGKAASNARSRAWPPTPTNVGVPAGTNLKAYNGSCTITKPRTVIKNKAINCAPLEIRTTGVVIQGSKINGAVFVGSQDDSDPAGKGATRVTVLDSEIDASSAPDLRPISSSHFVVKRSYLHGSYSGAECHNACKIKRSYVTGSGSHASGMRILRNGKLKHNTIWCEPLPNLEDGGCSGNLTMYQEFGTPENNVIKHNYFPAGSFYYSLKFNGSDNGRIRIIDNVFGKPQAGLADDWDRKPSNVWTGNKMTSGRSARP
jgi:hypothetical protein